ncbi:probable ubiquitin-like-specific protease 2B isoform X3 [Tanacetum coccineum]
MIVNDELPMSDLSIYDAVVTQQLLEPDSEIHEPKIMAAPKDDISVVADISTQSEDEAVYANSHEDPRLYQRSLSTFSDTPKDDGVFCGPSSDHCTSELEMVSSFISAILTQDDEEVTTVVLSPDHMAYQDKYCADWDSFIVQISLAGMTLLKIRVLMEDTLQAENVECPSGTELRFAFIGTDWFAKQEAVTSLNDTYKTLWTSIHESGDNVDGHAESSFPKYFPFFDQPFEEVIYPKGEIEAVSIGKRDVDMLLPDTFVNDTIIDFYIKYVCLLVCYSGNLAYLVFILADPNKEPLDACKGKEAFQRVRKCTRKVNLFEKDYIFIPVNYNYHWSLIVMCHLGEVATYQDEDVTKLSKVSCVLHMDPIRGNHTGLNGLMKSYLKEEWRGRVPETSEDICSKFDNLRFISLETREIENTSDGRRGLGITWFSLSINIESRILLFVQLPQQPNSVDCGLFLLHYIELFLEQAPINFNPFKISQEGG